MTASVELLVQGLATTLIAAVSTLSTKRRRRVDTSLCDAASVGDRRSVKRLLAAGVDPDSADEDRTTALMAAVFAGQADVARNLLDAGADPDRQDASGMTALMNAVIANGELELEAAHPVFQAIVQLLLERGAKVELRDADGLTANDHAMFLGLDDLAAQLRG